MLRAVLEARLFSRTQSCGVFLAALALSSASFAGEKDGVSAEHPAVRTPEARASRKGASRKVAKEGRHPKSGAAKANTPKKEPIVQGSSTPWCSSEVAALESDVCVAGAPKPGGPNDLVIFLHGVIAPNTTWQFTQEKAMLNAANFYHFTAIMPRGVQGAGPEGMKSFFAWPTAQAAREEYEEKLIAEWKHARSKLEKQRGKPFDHTYVFGFSSGAYYASSLALRAHPIASGFAMAAGGSATAAFDPASQHAPIYLAICANDKTTRDGSRTFADKLSNWGWPHRISELPVGHMFSPDMVGNALAYFRQTAKAKKAE